VSSISRAVRLVEPAQHLAGLDRRAARNLDGYDPAGGFRPQGGGAGGCGASVHEDFPDNWSGFNPAREGKALRGCGVMLRMAIFQAGL
jgi:hypothetical protein